MEIEIGKLKIGAAFYLSGLLECQVKSTELTVIPPENYTSEGYVLAKDSDTEGSYYSFFKTDKVFIKN